MSERPRDWDKELAQIDKAIAEQGSAPPSVPSGAPVVRPARPASGAPVTKTGHVVLTWFWVCLGLALAAALLLWPYDKTCGLQLTFFLGAVGTTAVFALLGAFSAWMHRRAFAHILSLIVLAWAGVAAANEILPRIGYAKESRTWLCPSAPTAPAVAPSAAPSTKPSTAPSTTPSPAPAQ
jgi:hypothetical protein